MPFNLTCPPKAQKLDNRPYRTVTTVEDVLAIADTLRAANIPFHLHGGWALAGLSGTTFKSSDVDLYIPDAYQETIERNFGTLIQARTRKRIMLNFHGAIIEISFLTRLRHNRWAMDYGINLWIIPDQELTGHTITLANTTIPCVSPAFMVAELTNTVNKKPQSQKKHVERLSFLEANVCEADWKRSRALWPMPGNFFTRLRVALMR